ncbi:Homeodomain-like protein [Mycena floridula]|nr:Homeodomain-like protein [Mycena floridula]
MPTSDPRALHPMIPHSHSSLASAMDPRSSTPYGRSSGHVPASYSPPPVSPTSSEEPTIKKKRKRADANQLKILVETYNRTAFPSTDERLELAKLLDMTPRSVQIWFQNRRQSMRQTRQTSGNPSTQQAFTMSSSPEAMMSMDEMASGSGYDMHLPGGSYMHEAQVSPTLTSAHRRARSQEAVIVDPRKGQWSRAY